MADCGKLEKKNPTQHIEKFTNSKVPLIFKWTKAYSKSMRSWDSRILPTSYERSTSALPFYSLKVICVMNAFMMVGFEWYQWLLSGFRVDLNNFFCERARHLYVAYSKLYYMMLISTCSPYGMVKLEFFMLYAYWKIDKSISNVCFHWNFQFILYISDIYK